jgi:hypothetical protein
MLLIIDFSSCFDRGVIGIVGVLVGRADIAAAG